MAGKKQKLNFHNRFRPANDVVFSVMNGHKEIFCPLINAVTGEKVVLLGDPHTQAERRENDVLLNTIRFDSFAEAKDMRFYSLDMNRTYTEARESSRTVYYACRVISTQDVSKMQYEELKPVHISFIYSDYEETRPIRHVKLLFTDDYEVYNNLIEITLVYVPAVVKEGQERGDLYTFACFFAISNQTEADNFVKNLGKTDLGKELIRVYNNAVANVNHLYEIEKSSYFTERLNEAQLAEVKQQGRNERSKEMARMMRSDGKPEDEIKRYTGYTFQDLDSLK